MTPSKHDCTITWSDCLDVLLMNKQIETSAQQANACIDTHQAVHQALLFIVLCRNLVHLQNRVMLMILELPSDLPLFKDITTLLRQRTGAVLSSVLAVFAALASLNSYDYQHNVSLQRPAQSDTPELAAPRAAWVISTGISPSLYSSPSQTCHFMIQDCLNNV